MKFEHGDGLGLREWVSRGIGDPLDAIRTPFPGGWPRPSWIGCLDGSETHWMLSTPLFSSMVCIEWPCGHSPHTVGLVAQFMYSKLVDRNLLMCQLIITLSC